MFRRTPIAIAALAALFATACGGVDDDASNANAGDPLEPYEGGVVEDLDCTPDLDGRIEADQLQPAIGVPVNYRVSPAGTERPINLAGYEDQFGTRVWDFSSTTDEYAGDQSLEIRATELRDQWYADEFSGGEFTTVLDPNLNLDAVYSHDGNILYLHGYASAEQQPSIGQTLVAYEQPVVAYDFPLQQGDAWTSVGEVHDGRVRDLPYTGTETYEFEIDATGELWLPDVTFDNVLRVRTELTIDTPIGNPRYRQQVQFLFECFGEVTRLVGPDRELNEEFSAEDYDFDTAIEMRRFGF